MKRFLRGLLIALITYAIVASICGVVVVAVSFGVKGVISLFGMMFIGLAFWASTW